MRVIGFACRFVLFFAATLASAGAVAQTFAGIQGDTRIVVGYQVKPELLVSWIPSGWEPTSTPGGPLQGANLFVLFIDRLRDDDAAGKSKGSPKRFVVFAVPVRHKETGRSTGAIISGWASHPTDVPGFYKVYRAASINVTQRTSTMGDLEEIASAWDIRDAAGGGGLEFRLRTARDPKARTSAKVEAFPMSGKDAAINRIYRQELSTDVVKSHSTGVDHVREFSLRVSEPALAKFLDGSERLVGVTLVPFYYRHVLLPK